ncbi:MAG: deoxyribose-phosphate aldolase [Spirochaetaceae bacterium]|nr:deoxyribose-phosphate aldolase [Spirochaetaceae bacterium]
MEKKWTSAEIASTIDHTLLKATATEKAIRELCAEAKQYGFASVCVNPCWVPLCAKELSGTNVAVCSVIGFPLGANSSQTKAEEASRAVNEGAREVDMVINIGKAKAGDWAGVEEDIAAVVKTSGPALVKVIIETCYLTNEEKIAACKAAMAAGANFVKTSTGFGTGGATAEDVALMKKTVEPALKVKASGGIRTRADAVAMLNAGADRIGASAGVSIISESEE